MPTVKRSRKRGEKTGRINIAKVEATTDADISRQIAKDPDTAPELTDNDLDGAVIVSADGSRRPYREVVPKVAEPAE